MSVPVTVLSQEVSDNWLSTGVKERYTLKGNQSSVISLNKVQNSRVCSFMPVSLAHHRSVFSVRRRLDYYLHCGSENDIRETIFFSDPGRVCVPLSSLMCSHTYSPPPLVTLGKVFEDGVGGVVVYVCTVGYKTDK